MDITVCVEGKRGCGFRKEKGLYLRFDGPGTPCGKLPVELSVCPCCSAGIKQSRGYTWVNADALMAKQECRAKDKCDPLCPLSGSIGRAGLLWVGEKFYRSPEDFTYEANLMGISRRIHTVPHGFEVGKTWVLLAHPKTVITYDTDTRELAMKPGIFRVFRPSRVEIVVSGDEPEEELEGYVKRGLTPVIVKRYEQEVLENVGETDDEVE